jgi:phospholipid/cholesterol/gamma-HCH transport system substrate-binding protein
MLREIRKRAGAFAAIAGLFIIAIAVGGYILSNQRVRFPLIQESTLEYEATFSTAQAVTPGQGQTVQVSGVKIGDIGAVRLSNGRAVVTMNIDPEYKNLIRTDATALLRPKTGLKDMFIDLDPGNAPAPFAKQHFQIPVQNTLPDINPDEIFQALDADTRDYLKLLINGAGRGLNGRGSDLAEVFARFEPTYRDIARVNKAVGARKTNLRRLIRSLNLLNGELKNKRVDVSQLIESSSVVFNAFAAEEANLSRAVRDFPGALRQTTDTLGKVERFAKVLTPTADELRPAIRALDVANRQLAPFAREAAPLIRDQIRPFVRGVRPLVRDLRPAAQNLAKATPDLTRSFVQLNHLFDLIGYNGGGRQGPEVANRDEGYLFWIAWVLHQGVNVFSTGDAHGPYRSLTASGTCGALNNLANTQFGPGGPAILGITNLLADASLCP